MSAMTIFYRERADEARKGAAAASLVNVRDRWLTSEATWTQLAVRCERADAIQKKLIVRKAAERALLAASAAA